MKPLNVIEYLQYMAPLVGETATDLSVPIITVIDQIFLLGILQKVDGIQFLVRPDGALEVRLCHGKEITLLPPLECRGSAISRLLVLGKMEKGEAARSIPQTTSAIIQNRQMIFETEPLGLWRENIRVRIVHQ